MLPAPSPGDHYYAKAYDLSTNYRSRTIAQCGYPQPVADVMMMAVPGGKSRPDNRQFHSPKWPLTEEFDRARHAYWTVIFSVALCDRLPDVPVTVRV